MDHFLLCCLINRKMSGNQEEYSHYRGIFVYYGLKGCMFTKMDDLRITEVILYINLEKTTKNS